MIYDLRINKNIQILISFGQFKLNNILSDGFKYSLLSDRKYLNNELFVRKFNFSIFKTHYRKVISIIKIKDNSYLSKIMDEIRYFLSFCGIEEKNSSEYSNIICELLDNAIEHGKSDCLIDIDLSNEYYKKENPIKKYFAVNIVVINFSENMIGELIEQLIKAGDKLHGYDKINEFEKIHSQYYDDDYTFKQFAIVASFQNRITSRNVKKTGGTGLTKLIKGLQETAELNHCYVISNETVLFFNKNELNLYDNKWFAFNKECDFSKRPSKESIKKSPIIFRGTAYNLQFVVEMEKKDENNKN